MLYPHFQRFLKQRALIERGATVVAAVSGGIDSMAMLDLLCRCSRSHKLEIVVAHVNHGLRGRASEADERLVRDEARRRGLAFRCERLTPRRGQNVQDSARRLRYAFLREVAAEFDAQAIALAHHRGDQAETILMHLLRGSGLAGLSGMRPLMRNGDLDIVRPLLFASRGQIEGHVRKHRLAFREDATNATTRYRRNAVRHELLPLLATFNPRIEEALAATGERMAEDDAALNVMAGLCLDEALMRQGAERIELNREEYRCHEPALRRRMLRLAYGALAGSAADLNADQLLRMDQIAMGQGGRGSYRLKSPFAFQRQGRILTICRLPGNPRRG